MTVQPALILASASPRRRELLRFFGVSFTAIATDAEDKDYNDPPAILSVLPSSDTPLKIHPTLLAWRKAASCRKPPGSVIIGADTIVVLDGDVLGKPIDQEHARAMLRRLSGRTHTVYTGLAVLCEAHPPLFDLVTSQVTIADLSERVIVDYVATGEPMDKAGAYGIQGLGGWLVQRVEGSYTNVVGLPLPNLHRLLVVAGLNNLVSPSEAYYSWLNAQGKEPLPCPPTFP